MTTLEPSHITRAKRALELLNQRTELTDNKPSGITTIADILAAERKLAASEDSLREYEASTDGMRETLDAAGRRGIVVEKFRMDQIESLRLKIEHRHRELQGVWRQVFAFIEKD